jgi:hypothetical protein
MWDLWTQFRDPESLKNVKVNNNFSTLFSFITIDLKLQVIVKTLK